MSDGVCVIHAPRESYEIYAGWNHVRTRGLRLLILKSIGSVGNATRTEKRKMMAVKSGGLVLHAFW